MEPRELKVTDLCVRGGGRVSGVRVSVENDPIREIPEVSQRSRQGSVGVESVL